jgi:hypothetical protein
VNSRPCEIVAYHRKKAAEEFREYRAKGWKVGKKVIGGSDPRLKYVMLVNPATRWEYVIVTIPRKPERRREP